MNGNKKHIRFITTVGDKENIKKELEERVEIPTIPENREQLIKELENFKKEYNDDNYNLSDDFATYMSNKTGKYLVICMTIEHMYQMIRKTHEMFDKVNPNIKVSYIGGKMFDSAKDEMFRKFEEQDSDKATLNLLFLNKASVKNYNIQDVDGVVLLCYARYHTKRNLGIVNKALKTCKNDSVVIQVVNSVDTISKYETLQEVIKSEDKYEIDFESSKSCTVAETLRKSIYSKKLHDKIKLEYFRDYKKETGKRVAFGAIYKGHNIGTWKNNFRQKDLNGELVMDDKLRKEFEKEGILGERLRRTRTTDKEKFDLLLKFYKNNPNTEILINTVDEKGNPIGEYRSWLQTKVNKKTSELTKKQIDTLKDLGFLNLSLKEIEDLIEEYRIPRADITTIVKHHKTIKNFILKYKTKKVESSMKLNKRGIVLSKNELSMKQKQAYITLLEDMYGENVLDDTTKFVEEEDILKAIEKLSDKRKQLIIERYGLDGQEPKKFKDIGNGFINSRQQGKNLVVTALKKMSEDIPIYSIKDLRNSRDKTSKKLNILNSMTYNQWEWKKIVSDISFLGLSENLTQRLKKDGFIKMMDLFGASEEELLKIPGIGVLKIKEIIRKTKEYEADITPTKKEEETKILENELQILKTRISNYGRGYYYYLNYEDIFHQDQIIPASIIAENSSKLKSKYAKKTEKEEILEDLDAQVNNQDKKSEKLRNVLGIPEEIIKKEES